MKVPSLLLQFLGLVFVVVGLVLDWHNPVTIGCTVMVLAELNSLRQDEY